MGCCLGKGGGKKTDEDAKLIRDSKLPIIWVLGGPGSGKGTQCSRLAEAYSFKHLSTGDLLRAEVESGSDLGKSVSEKMDKGELVPGDIVLTILKKAMVLDINWAKGYLIDGYPREVSQSEDFEKQIAPCSLILYLRCSDDVMKERLLSRGAGRADDTEDAINTRLETFHRVSEAVMDKYSSKVATIDADQEVDVIFQQCQEKMDSLLKAQ